MVVLWAARASPFQSRGVPVVFCLVFSLIFVSIAFELEGYN